MSHTHTHTQARSTHKLNLDDYNLVNFPPEILNLPNLRLLSLKNNHLEDVPEEIAILSRLEVNRQYKSTNTDAPAGTKVQILTLTAGLFHREQQNCQGPRVNLLHDDSQRLASLAQSAHQRAGCYRSAQESPHLPRHWQQSRHRQRWAAPARYWQVSVS